MLRNVWLVVLSVVLVLPAAMVLCLTVAARRATVVTWRWRTIPEAAGLAAVRVQEVLRTRDPKLSLGAQLMFLAKLGYVLHTVGYCPPGNRLEVLQAVQGIRTSQRYRREILSVRFRLLVAQVKIFCASMLVWIRA